ncbi:MAG: hypothetical protein GC190_17015 [Alphaproteobacteria bacterium]|nr:hypothetical protein [Alphaproteobacteria bacterium]
MRALVWAVGLSLALGAAAQAEEQQSEQATGAPRGLAPPSQPADQTTTTTTTTTTSTTSTPQSAPSQAVPAPSSGEARSTADWQTDQTIRVPTQPGQPNGPAVTVTGLGRVDPSGAGLMAPSDGGLQPDLWRGSTRVTIENDIAALPNAPNSPAMQTLMRRLLLTSAAPPSGNGRSDESLLALRLNKLVANGWTAEAAALAPSAPRDDSAARQALAEAMLLQGQGVAACGQPTAIRQSSNDPYWLKMRAFCYLLTGDMQSAQLTIDVMHERQIEDDAFFALASQMTDKTEAKIASLPNPSGLHVALAHLAGARLPVSIVDSGWVPSYRLFAAATSDHELQLAAAERAAAAGLIQIDQLRAAYDSEQFSTDQLDDPEEAAKKLSSPKANALFYQAIEKRTIPAARATAFSAALLRADSQNEFALFALVAADAAMEITPTPDLAWLVPQIERVLLYTGNDAQAERWYVALSGGSPSDAPAINALQLHTVLGEPTAARTAKVQGALSWLGEHALKPGVMKAWLADRAAREIPLFDALGYLIPPDAQWALTANTTGVVPTPEQAQALDAMTQAAAQHRVGETILNALIALGKAGPERAEGRTVSRVVKALVAVGLTEEARAIAIEAVLGAPSNVH